MKLLTGGLLFSNFGKGERFGMTDGVFHVARMNCLKLICETPIDVVQEARQACSMMSEGIKALNDISLPAVPILRCGRQRTHVSAEVLSPILNILGRRTFPSVSFHPSPDIGGKALVKLGKILGDDESIVPNIVPINELERIASVAPIA